MLSQRDRDILQISSVVIGAAALLFFIVRKKGTNDKLANAVTSASPSVIGGSTGGSGLLGISPAATYTVDPLGLPDLPPAQVQPPTYYTPAELGLGDGDNSTIAGILKALTQGSFGGGCCVSSPGIPWMTAPNATPIQVSPTDVGELPTVENTVYNIGVQQPTSYVPVNLVPDGGYGNLLPTYQSVSGTNLIGGTIG